MERKVRNGKGSNSRKKKDLGEKQEQRNDKDEEKDSGSKKE